MPRLLLPGAPLSQPPARRALPVPSARHGNAGTSPRPGADSQGSELGLGFGTPGLLRVGWGTASQPPPARGGPSPPLLGGQDALRGAQGSRAGFQGCRYLSASWGRLPFLPHLLRPSSASSPSLAPSFLHPSAALLPHSGFKGGREPLPYWTPDLAHSWKHLRSRVEKEIAKDKAAGDNQRKLFWASPTHPSTHT